MARFDENMAVGKSKYLVTLYLHELKQPSDLKTENQIKVSLMISSNKGIFYGH